MMSDTHDKQAVALSSVAASALMTLGKLVVGLLTGSLGILSEAAHSLLDLGAATLTYFAVKLSDRPADDNHPYGHGKVEAVSALIETGLLFVTGIWIIREAVLRLMSDDVTVETTWYSVAVIVVSIMIDFGRSRALMKVAKATKSQALEADALHFSSDILSSLVVLFGLGCVALGYPKGDSIAAIGVSLFVFKVGYGMGKRTIDVLLDAAPEGLAEKIEAIAHGVPGVARVDHVRARPVGNTVFVEVRVRVNRVMLIDRAEQVCEDIEAAIRKEIPEASPFVKAEPLALDDESIIDTVRLSASRMNLMVHDLSVHTLGKRKQVSFDIEVDETLNIKTAHEIAMAVETSVREALGEDVEVDTHIDPRRQDVVTGTPLDDARTEEFKKKILAVAQDVRHLQHVHNIRMLEGTEGLYISLHCLFPPDAKVRIVHDATVALEQKVRQEIPGVGRVVVHAEPLGNKED